MKRKTKAELQNEVKLLQRRIAELGKSGKDASSGGDRPAAEPVIMEAEYRGIFDAAKDTFLIFDLNGVIREVNPAACEMYGYSRDEIIGLTGKDIVHPDYQHLFEEFVKKASEGGIFSAESVDIRKDGSSFYIEVRGSGLTYNGEPHLLAVVRDITERKKTRERIEHLNAALQAVRDVNHLIVKEKRRDVLIQSACNTLVRSRGFQGAWIALTNGPAESVEVAQVGFDAPSFEAFADVFRTGELPACCQRSEDEGRAIAILDPASACRGCPLAEAYAGNAAMGVVLRHQNRYYGYLGVCVPPEFVDDTQEAGLVEEIVDNISFALNSMDMEKERERHEQEMDIRNRINYIILTISDDRMFGEVLSVVLKVMESPLGLFGYINENGYLICPSMTRDVWEKCDVPDKDIVLPPEQWGGIWGRAMIEQKTLYANKPFKVPEGHLPINKALDVPLVYQGALIGNLLVANKEMDYNKGDIQLLETIAGHLAPLLAAKLQSWREEKARIESEAALTKSEQTLRAMFDTATDGILLVDAKTLQFVRTNATMCRMLGYSQEELTALSVDHIHPAENIPRVIGMFEKRVQGDITLAPGIAVKRKDGSIFPADISAAHLDLDGRPHLLVIFRDITSRKRAEEEHEELQAQLIQAQKLESIGNLAGGIAHDFNNLLTTILGCAELMLVDIPNDDPLRESIEGIKAAGERAASLTRQLLAFSRRQVLQPEVMNLNETTRNMEKMLRRMIREDIELQTILAPDLGQVEADVSQIEQVIVNLVVNARDAMPGGGKITIKTENVYLDDTYAQDRAGVTPGPYVMLSVSDTGMGMTEDVQAQVFEPFFSTKEKGKGTGLGLSTVYGIVKQSKGNIWVYSEPGKGATFKVYLPLVEKSIPETEREEEDVEALTGSETVLVVEDDEQVRRLAIRSLKGYGYSVLAAANGEEAIEVAGKQSEPIHLLLTDVIMPGISSKDMVERLKSTRPEMKVLYMSGYTDNGIVNQGILDTGVVFLGKPFAPEALGRKVRQVLEA
jgi:two-component system cell cycle sensor histidine kinase/response regulator CckA